MCVCTFSPVPLSGVQLEIRIPGNTTTCTISGLEAGLEYNVNVFAVINNSISVPASITVSTCKCRPIFCFVFYQNINLGAYVTFHSGNLKSIYACFLEKGSEMLLIVNRDRVSSAPLVVIPTCNTCSLSLILIK